MNNKDLKEILKPAINRKAEAPKPGEIVRVHQKITEKGKERIQIFEGLVIATKKTKNIESTFTVRKVVDKVGVERIYPLYSPHITKIERVSKIHSRQSKLYYLREVTKKLRTKKTEKNETIDKKEEPAKSEKKSVSRKDAKSDSPKKIEKKNSK